MQTLFLLIYRYRAFLFFLFLEGICVWLIVSNNRYQGAWFFNSANAFVGYINTTSTNIKDYFTLADINAQLAQENAELKKEIALLSSMTAHRADTAATTSDSAQFEFFEAKIVNNSSRRLFNYITINKGLKHGIYPDMGIVGPTGVIGKVKDVSENFATVYSLLHTNLLTSVYLKSAGNFCTLQWDGVDPQYSKLHFVPRHINAMVGDTVLTSGYSTVFPPNLMVGTIASVNIAPNQAFYDLRVKLSMDFDKLSFVYCITNQKKTEQEQLEKATEE